MTSCSNLRPQTANLKPQSSDRNPQALEPKTQAPTATERLPLITETHPSSAFPTATIVGYPRIGPDRELKRATEAYWKGTLSETELLRVAENLKDLTYARLVELGLGKDDYSIPETSSLYDQVLDTAVTFGAIPPRYEKLSGLDQYFALARGNDDLGALEMTKWFDTNYHYLVPELAPGAAFAFSGGEKLAEFQRAREAGYLVRPTFVGPVTFLALAKAADEAGEGWTPLALIEDLTAAYAQLLAAFHESGAKWVQFDEPALTSDNLDASRKELVELAKQVWSELSELEGRPSLLVTLPYGDGTDAAAALAETDIEALQVDLRRTPELSAELVQKLEGKTLAAGVVEGRNIWRADLRHAESVLQGLQEKGATALSACTATSLQHVPINLEAEKWDDSELDAALHEWLAFADQKVTEVVLLGQGLREGWESIESAVADSDAAIASRRAFPGVVRSDVRARVEAVTEEDTDRESTAERKEAQKALGLPPLPTTTIGSFPQTLDIRRSRAAFARGEITEEEYQEAMQAEIASVIALQEDIGLDVLVHGEAERNDMVQYFAEQLDGFAATKNGWVQSYGTRCTRPSVLWGDVDRPQPMTLKWTTYADSLTDKPVKGMLTGPTTMIAWSFPREDLPFGEVAAQIGLALRQEVNDLEAAGIRFIQVDEPALRELLPLDEAKHQEYLDESVRAFRLSTSGVDAGTQIHTHLCYSEFGQILEAILDLNADVTSIEAARSRMELLDDVDTGILERDLGPGIWDIHSPRVPSTEELVELLQAASASVDPDLLWANPDCGLKTRGYKETEASLRNLVAAAKQVREQG